jgi:hypothetical protein
LPHSDDAALSNGNTLSKAALATHKGSCAHSCATVHDGCGGDVAVIRNDRIMFDQRHAIHDAIAANRGPSIDYRAMHHDTTRP